LAAFFSCRESFVGSCLGKVTVMRKIIFAVLGLLAALTFLSLVVALLFAA
jgi:hypothetical protein